MLLEIVLIKEIQKLKMISRQLQTKQANSTGGSKIQHDKKEISEILSPRLNLRYSFLCTSIARSINVIFRFRPPISNLIRFRSHDQI